MRLTLTKITGLQELHEQLYSALSQLAKRDFNLAAVNKSPLENCCSLLISGGAHTMVVQARVHDPDFLAEFSAYYSRQFIDISRFCTRLHFFKVPMVDDETILSFLDRVSDEDYLGFVTLRPVIKSPIGVSILSASLSVAQVRSIDRFPVHLGGKEFSVHGTPFMQQDNAVGACAQASIWMALRTLRKKEGDRAYDPAQITDAATRYFVNGRVRPNRQGLTSSQMIEAIRAAGYAPHQVQFAANWGQVLDQNRMVSAKIVLHAYLESGIPVVLVLAPPSGGHAVVLIGQSIVENPSGFIGCQLNLDDATAITIKHTVSWSPSFLIHNDNTGPYKDLPDVAGTPNEYEFQHCHMAIPLLPVDIFMSGEEAFAISTQLLADFFLGFKLDGNKTHQEIEALAADLSLRLLLVEKRRLRKWAANGGLVPEMSEQLRLMDLPKRVWMLEIHRASHYGNNVNGPTPSLVGIILIDPTADIPHYSFLMAHLNLPDLLGLQHGVIVTWDHETGVPTQGTQTNDNGPIIPISPHC
jgi:hypothetical protein